jgi:hypothetical protein
MRAGIAAGMCLFVVGLAGASFAQGKSARIVFLHHSTGEVIWKGGVPEWMQRYNSSHGTRHAMTPLAFPKDKPYGWNNYPYDYWNIWVKHGGPKRFKDEPTLEILTRQYDVIVFKHCFPGSNVSPDEGKATADSDEKTMQNYKLQYAALKKKLRQFPRTKFILWTNPAQTKAETNVGDAKRAKQFADWMRKTWDEKGDNIFLWDFRQLETEGGLYAKPEATAKGDDPHPSAAFARKVAPYFGQRVIDVIEGRGDSGSITGK